MNNYKRYLRAIVLTVIVALVSVAAYSHQVYGGGKSPSIHALCPFGGLESLYMFFTQGSFISKIFSGTLILFFITLILAILFRRSFCGLICPFGAIQELFGYIGQKLLRKRFMMPSTIDKPLRYLKYLVLVITIFYAWKTAGLWMSPYDPWSTYAHLISSNPFQAFSDVVDESLIGLIVLLITLVGSFMYDRFFCKYLCPAGAFYGIIGKISPMKIKRNENLCVDCGKCSKACPANIDVANTKYVNHAECINCNVCIASCPKTDALEVKYGKISFKPSMATILVIFLFFGSIFIFETSGIYKVIPERIASGETISLNEVKGYMTIEEASKAVGLSLGEFYDLYKIPKSVESLTKMKDIKKVVPSYDFDQIKETLAK